MPLPARFHPEALAELVDAAGYYGARSTLVGEAFVEAIDEALARIAEMPRAAPTWPGRPEVRRRVLARFSYAIVYAIEPEAIFVIAIEHTSRRPGYWIDRL
jgi:plasmid stabilization system protein ParE